MLRDEELDLIYCNSLYKGSGLLRWGGGVDTFGISQSFLWALFFIAHFPIILLYNLNFLCHLIMKITYKKETQGMEKVKGRTALKSRNDFHLDGNQTHVFVCVAITFIKCHKING